MITDAIKRSKRDNLQYDSKEELYNKLKPIYEQNICQICKKTLIIGINKRSDISPSIDRIDNTKGYTSSNVTILCYRCNALKNNGTWQEHQAISNWVKEYLNDRKELPD